MDVIIHQAANVFYRQSIGLAAIVQRDRRYWHARAERLGDADRTPSPGVVSIEHEKYAVEAVCEEISLMSRQRRAHEPHHWVPRLMDRDRVEEAFDHDDRARFRRDHSMEVEEDERLSEACRESILRLLAVDRAARVCNQLAGGVVNRDYDSPPQ
jgi:hypothetical protein